MNIFRVDNDPILSAQMLCDKHIVKMPLETAQMLCSVWHRYGQGTNVPYKEVHKKHPCTLWAGDSMDNYNWLWQHGMELCFEYTRRYNKIHKSQQVIMDLSYPSPSKFIFDTRVGTPQPQCIPDEYKVDNDVVLGYRNYYVGAKRLIAKWKHFGSMPKWFERRIENV